MINMSLCFEAKQRFWLRTVCHGGLACSGSDRQRLFTVPRSDGYPTLGSSITEVLVFSVQPEQRKHPLILLHYSQIGGHSEVCCRDRRYQKKNDAR